MRRLLPSPWLSLGLFGGWLLLTRSFSIGQVLLAKPQQTIFDGCRQPANPGAPPSQRK